jgi:hypothetical protein
VARRSPLLWTRAVCHLFEALSIIKEIKEDTELTQMIGRCDHSTIASFDTVANFLKGDDFKLMAKMRNVVAFHYDPKLPIRRLKNLVDKFPDHATPYSLGSDTLDWYFELGDLIADEILIREVFEIPDSADLKRAALEILDRLHVMGTAFTDFAGYFIRCCAKQA